MKSFYKIAAIAALAVASASCDDLFDPAFEPSQDLNTIKDFPKYADGLLYDAYLLMPYGSDVKSDLATDDAVSNDNANDYLKVATGSWTANNGTLSYWKNGRAGIQFVNLLLSKVDEVDFSDTERVQQLFARPHQRRGSRPARPVHVPPAAPARRLGRRRAPRRAPAARTRRRLQRLQPAPRHLQGLRRADLQRRGRSRRAAPPRLRGRYQRSRHPRQVPRDGHQHRRVHPRVRRGLQRPYVRPHRPRHRRPDCPAGRQPRLCRRQRCGLGRGSRQGSRPARPQQRPRRHRTPRLHLLWRRHRQAGLQQRHRDTLARQHRGEQHPRVGQLPALAPRHRPREPHAEPRRRLPHGQRLSHHRQPRQLRRQEPLRRP